MKTPQFWQSRNLISTLLAPASALYALGAWAERSFTTPTKAPIPVISIGNVTAGGAGKTPTAIALIPMLQALGHTPHILTRGYKGAALNAHRVSEGDDWRSVGDEALLLAKAAPTWVGRNRLASANAAAAMGATLVVCDDALQHHALHKDISLLVIDGAYGIGNGTLLPAGPLRETLVSATKRCDAAIIIGDDVQQLGAQLSIPTIAATLSPVGNTNVLQSTRWLAFAGIGRPEKFFTTLREYGAEIVATQHFADHHAYSEADITMLVARAKELDATLITTEKDAVKLPRAYAASIAVLPVSLSINAPKQLMQILTNITAA